MQYKILYPLYPQAFCAQLFVLKKSAAMFIALYWLLFKLKTASHLPFCFLLERLQSPLHWFVTYK